MTKKAKAKIKKPNGAYQFVPAQSITLMLRRTFTVLFGMLQASEQLERD